VPIRRRAARAAVAALTVLLVSACGSSVGTALPTATASVSAPPTATPSASPVIHLKPALAGLLDRDGPPPAGYESVMGGFVVNVYWKDLQPFAGAPIATDNALDQAIVALHQVDPSGRMGLKVRLFAGIYAPDWAKALGGQPIPIDDPVTGASGTIGPFWTDAFGAAYGDLQARLAARYDSVPEIREITIARCTTAYAEPFIRDLASASTVSALLAAGFTVAADHRCHSEEIQAHQVWALTRSDLAFNPYQVIDGSARSDEAFTESMMDLCRSTLGPRCVLENNSLRFPPLYPPMYAHLQGLGPPIAFQTAVLAKVGDLGSALDTAIGLGAGSVELPAGFQELPVTALAAYNSRLLANSTS
jgi:hypothetical protein